LQSTIAALLLFACTGGQALELVTEADPPLNMLRDGKVVGIATDKLQEAFRRAGVFEHIELMPWARAYESALTQPGYCVFSAARTTGREALFKWVGPVAAVDWVLYARTDTAPPERLQDIRTKSIGGYLQDVISIWLTDHGYHVETAIRDADNPKKLLGGRIDYWASTRPRATALLAGEHLAGQIVPVLTFGHTELYLACHRDTADSIVRRLNRALSHMRSDGTAARIEARYARQAGAS
jgi:polar amino acid transport system substrate-binding protein